MKDLIATMEEWFSKLPPLPANAKETLVVWAPWLALIFGILGVLASLAGLGLTGVVSPLLFLGGAAGIAATSMVGALLGLVSSGLMLAAYPGLKARKAQGWMMSFWSEAVSVVGSLLALNVFGAIVGGAIGFYLLFQIRKYYK